MSEQNKPNELTEIKEGNVLELWAPKHPEVAQWLSHLQKKAKSAYYFYRFCQWARKTPAGLLALKEDPSSKEAEKLLNIFVATSLETLQMTHSIKVLTVQQVRSFFKWSMCDLAKIAGQMTFEKKKQYNKLTKEGLRKLRDNAYNPRDRALVTFVCSTAIAKETLSEIRWGHLEEDWEKADLPCVSLPSSLIKGHGIGKYKNVKQITFLTPEAKRDLINYKEWIERSMKRGVTPEDNVFRETCAPYGPASYDTLGYLVWRLSQRAGVPFSWHDARRWVNTALEQIGISSNWARKIRGRMVRGEEAPYSQPAIEQLRAKFREAVPLLEFTSETAGAVEDRLKDLEAFRQSLTPEQQELARRGGMRFKRRGKTLAKPENSEKCDDGEHCQKVASEGELPKLLTEGWRASVVLPSGKIVVER